MSWWTDILLTASNLEALGNSDKPDQYVAIDQINAWLRENAGKSELFLISNADRNCPSSCFAGSFKVLPWTEFLEVVQAAPWQWPEQVQMFMRDEDDNGFQEIDLGLDPERSRKPRDLEP